MADPEVRSTGALNGVLRENRGYARGPNGDRARTGLARRPSSRHNTAPHRGVALPNALPHNAGEYSIRYATCSGPLLDTSSRPPRQGWRLGSPAGRESRGDVAAGQS